MTGMTGMTRVTRKTGCRVRILFWTFQGQISHSSRIPIIALSIMSFLVLPQHDCNFNFYPEGLSVFAPFRLLRIWVG